LVVVPAAVGPERKRLAQSLFAQLQQSPQDVTRLAGVEQRTDVRTHSFGLDVVELDQAGTDSRRAREQPVQPVTDCAGATLPVEPQACDALRVNVPEMPVQPESIDLRLK